ncbi:minor capsid protein [Methanolapillus millepedarum]|uniref:Phage head morphogenesis domain-containing protein n=1 Tax=Methanolapillus millepedarum TaxID=3028296 RepID=A0AA96V4S5_9EURY|nr:hypothetical protein MsAc7_17760 [Methanosarcinaceae archaeon Ac7]
MAISSQSEEYWTRRFENLEKAQQKKGAQYYRRLETEYQKADRALQAEISDWYARFAKNNNMTIQEARKLLNAGELAEFKWTVDDYIKYGQENALDQKWMKELENASAKVHISRLEALQLSMQQEVEKLYKSELDGMTRLLGDEYVDGKYQNAWIVQTGTGVGSPFPKVKKSEVEKVLSRPWTADGKTFSDRVWADQNKLVNELQSEMSQMIQRGAAPDEAIKNISERMNVSKSSAGRLVMTESAYFSSESQKETFKELGVQEYEFIATLDEKTCKRCGPLDKKVAPMSFFKAGGTAPPVHPNCRCTTIPHFDDMGDWGATRAARDQEGKYYEVPSGMSFEEWKKEFVEKKEPDKTFKHVDLSKAEKDVPEYVSNIRRIYQEWDGEYISEYAMPAMKELGIEAPLFVREIEDISSTQAVSGRSNFEDIDSTHQKIQLVELNPADPRSAAQRAEVANHEFFHAKSSMLEHDMLEMGVDEWTEVEETMCETAALYTSRAAGFGELYPSYNGFINKNVPLIVSSIPEFAGCKTITDFGKIAAEYRFGSAATAKWLPFKKILSANFDYKEYYKNYIPYLNNNKDYIISVLEKENPRTSRARIVSLLDSVLDDFKGGAVPARSFTPSEEYILQKTLSIAIQNEGIKKVTL